jgi:hypothetical protein
VKSIKAKKSNAKKGAKPISLKASAKMKVKAYKAKPKGKTAKVLPKTARRKPVTPMAKKRK